MKTNIHAHNNLGKIHILGRKKSDEFVHEQVTFTSTFLNAYTSCGDGYYYRYISEKMLFPYFRT